MPAIKGADIAVCTCILPYKYTTLRPPIYYNPRKDRVHYWIITDWAQGIYPWWDYIIRPNKNSTSRRNMQQYKMLSHVYLPEYRWIIFQDGNIRLRVDPVMLVDKLIESGKSVAFGLHPWRDCSYEEGHVCAPFKSNNAEIINDQLGRYEAEGFPHNFGLAASTFFVRDNYDPKACEFFDIWLSETARGSHRNQISWGPAVWKSGIDMLMWNLPWGHNDYWTQRKNV